MKFSKQLTRTRFAKLSTVALLAGAYGILSLQAADQPAAPSATPVVQRQFATPDEAVKALRTAAEAKDQTALCEIFGPECREILTGDKVQDANNAQRFATAMAQGCNQVKEGDDKITLEVGTNNWPMPIPLVKADGQWHFDTAAGKEEIINRHIGKDELHAIGVCRAYVTAQKQYAGRESENRRRGQLRAEIQKLAREEGRPLLAGGGQTNRPAPSGRWWRKPMPRAMAQPAARVRIRFTVIISGF